MQTGNIKRGAARLEDRKERKGKKREKNASSGLVAKVTRQARVENYFIRFSRIVSARIIDIIGRRIRKEFRQRIAAI